jgi:hypothetical protein
MLDSTKDELEVNQQHGNSEYEITKAGPYLAENVNSVYTKLMESNKAQENEYRQMSSEMGSTLYKVQKWLSKYNY